MMSRRSTLKTTLAALLATVKSDASFAGQLVRKAGFHMPLESKPHLRTFMQWPAMKSIYGSQRELDAVRTKIALIANSIAKFEPVVMLVRPEQLEGAKDYFNANVEFWPMAVQDLWCRDSGPTFVVNADGQMAISELNFNGWGEKQPYEDDSKIAQQVSDKLSLPLFENALKGEGGGVESDGAGTLIAHASCWVNPNRNSGSADEIGNKLCEALGAEKIIWAPGVIGADITDYHIDALARFIKPGQVLIQLPKTVIDSDPWSSAAYETYNILKTARDAQGRKLDIVVIPDPLNIRSRSKQFVSSYVNYFVCNGAVLGAEFGDDKADSEAARVLQQLYPEREVVSLNVDAIGEAGGGIHCSTQQQPMASL
jgi:agmatine deiminase